MKHIPHEYSTPFGIEKDKVDSAKSLVSNAKKIARTMSASYNQKKKAFESSKTSFHNTGSLDISRIHSYRTSDDIFLKNSILKDGSSHGLICALDYSMSMRSMIPKMAIQFLITSLFCKYSDIKFTFFTFTTGSGNGMPLYDGNAIFTEVGNDNMSEKQLIDIFYYMLSYYEQLDGTSTISFSPKYLSFLRKTFKMSMTPLHAAVFQSYLLAKNMKEDGIQNVTILIINDGDNNEHFYSDDNIIIKDSAFYGSIEDPFSKRVYTINDTVKKQSSNMLISPMNRMIRDNGIKIINMYLNEFLYYPVSDTISEYIKDTDKDDINIIPNNRDKYNADMVTKMYTEVNNLCYYNSVLFINTKVFPSIGNSLDDKESDIITNHRKKIKSLTVIGKYLSDKMVEDFKIKQ